jgi:hypothetical protein
MFGMKSAVLLKADTATEPVTVLLGGTTTDTVAEIQKMVGGNFDAVRRIAADTAGKVNKFTLVGYVHDEGMLLNLPVNPMASMLFDQNIFGDCVLVNATNPETQEDDGEDYDIPVQFADYLREIMFSEVQESVMFTKLLAKSASVALAAGVVTEEELERVSQWMLNESDSAVGGSLSDMPKELSSILKRCLRHSMGLSDDDIS